MTDAVVAFLRANGTLDMPGLAALALVFVVTGLLPIPRTALCIASGAIFGLAAIPVILPSTTLGSVIGFLAARYLLAARLQRAIVSKPKARAVLDAVASEGWRIVGLMRFASPMPTFSQNYLFGLTRIGFAPYLLATFFFSIPQIGLYVALGAQGRVALLDEGNSPWSRTIALVAVVCLLTVALMVARKVQTALRQVEAGPGKA